MILTCAKSVRDPHAHTVALTYLQFFRRWVGNPLLDSTMLGDMALQCGAQHLVACKHCNSHNQKRGHCWSVAPA